MLPVQCQRKCLVTFKLYNKKTFKLYNVMIDQD